MNTKTKRTLARMMREPTGIGLCDSGGEGGRHWQKNRVREFEQDPEASYEARALKVKWYVKTWWCSACDSEWTDRSRYDSKNFNHACKVDASALFNGKLTEAIVSAMDSVSITSSTVEEKLELDIRFELSVFHFLADRLEFAPNLDVPFQNWLRRSKEAQEMHHLEAMEAWLDKLDEKGELVTRWECVNTYNAPDLLSQTLQYIPFEHKSFGSCVILQIHNGADVRGGYTKPRIFMAALDELSGNADGMLACESACGSAWVNRCADSHWRDEDHGGDLYDFEIVEFDPSLVTCTQLEGGLPHKKDQHVDSADPLCNFAEPAGDDVLAETYAGKLVVKDGKLLCPHCGSGKLEACLP